MGDFLESALNTSGQTLHKAIVEQFGFFVHLNGVSQKVRHEIFVSLTVLSLFGLFQSLLASF